MRLKQGLKKLPDGIDIVTYVTHDGEPPTQIPAPAPQTPDATKPVALGHLRDSYVATHGNGTIESTTLAMRRIHFGHLVGFFREESLPVEMTLTRLQEYVNQRAQEGVTAGTIRLEIGTFRAAWNWGVPMSLTMGVFPSKGLRYPKDDEKPAFMTKTEIERQVAAGGDADDLWNPVVSVGCRENANGQNRAGERRKLRLRRRLTRPNSIRGVGVGRCDWTSTTLRFTIVSPMITIFVPPLLIGTLP
jgi:hypothetical protein